MINSVCVSDKKVYYKLNRRFATDLSLRRDNRYSFFSIEDIQLREQKSNCNNFEIIFGESIF